MNKKTKKAFESILQLVEVIETMPFLEVNEDEIELVKSEILKLISGDLNEEILNEEVKSSKKEQKSKVKKVETLSEKILEATKDIEIENNRNQILSNLYHLIKEKSSLSKSKFKDSVKDDFAIECKASLTKEAMFGFVMFEFLKMDTDKLIKLSEKFQFADMSPEEDNEATEKINSIEKIVYILKEKGKAPKEELINFVLGELKIKVTTSHAKDVIINCVVYELFNKNFIETEETKRTKKSVDIRDFWTDAIMNYEFEK